MKKCSHAHEHALKYGEGAKPRSSACKPSATKQNKCECCTVRYVACLVLLFIFDAAKCPPARGTRGSTIQHARRAERSTPVTRRDSRHASRHCTRSGAVRAVWVCAVETAHTHTPVGQPCGCAPGSEARGPPAPAAG